MGAALSVQRRLVVGLLDGALGGGVDVGTQRVQVRLHEPGQRLEIDKLDGVGGRRVPDDGLRASTLLAVSVDRSSGEQRGIRTHQARRHLLLRQDQVKVGTGWQLVAAERVRGQAGLGGLAFRLDVHGALWGGVDADAVRVRGDEGTGTAQWSAEDISKGPGGLGALVQGKQVSWAL